MKVGSSARKQCPKCKFIRRGKKGGKKILRVICPSNPRHKARQG